MRILFALLAVAAGPALTAEPVAFGAPMPAGDPIGIAEVAANPTVFGNEPRLFAGRITQVCQKKGCWVVLEQDGASARVMAKDHGFAVPTGSSGPAVAYGMLEMAPISAEQARHLVEDDGAAPPAERELRIVATAIRIGG